MPKKIEVQLECPECKGKIGQPHVAGCGIERCSSCFGQLISCRCRRRDHDPWLSIWTGEYPGMAMARMLGLWIRCEEATVAEQERGSPMLRWIPCGREHPDAIGDVGAIGEIAAGRRSIGDILYERGQILRGVKS